MKNNIATTNAPISQSRQLEHNAISERDLDWRPVAAAQISLLKLWAQGAVESLSKSGDGPLPQKNPAEHEAGQ
jgi:hypothetical protein